MDFGVFLQCYKQPFATYNAIRSVREHYPSCTIVILSDNGYDYTELACLLYTSPSPRDS